MNFIAEHIQYAILQGVFHSLWIGVIIGAIAMVIQRVIKSSRIKYFLFTGLLLIFFLTFLSIIGSNLKTSPTLWIENADSIHLSIGNTISFTSLDQASQQDSDSWYEQLFRNFQIRKYVSFFWILGCIITSIIFLVRLFSLQVLKRRAFPAPGNLETLLTEVKKKYNYTQPIRLLLSDKIISPMMTGWIKPIIYLPFQIQSNLTFEQIEVVFAHELAHIKRWDYPVKIVQNIILCILYFHPATWWLSRTIDLEREHCCDLEVLKIQSNPFTIAESLLSIQKSGKRLHPELGLGFSNKTNVTLIRIKKLFGQSPELIINSNYITMLITIITLLVGFNFIDFQTNEQTNPTDRIYGIENCRIISGVKTKNGQKKYATSSTYTYDDQGREKKWSYYFEDGSLYYANESVYDADGRRSFYLHFNSEGVLESKYKFTYDKNGHEKEMIHLSLDGNIKDKWVYTTDVNGKITREDRINSDGNTRSYLIYNYDQKGNLIQKDIYRNNGQLYSSMISTFDEENREKTFGEYLANGEELYLFTWTYGCKEE